MWLWLQRTDDSKPWAETFWAVSKEAKALFQVATRSEISDGNYSLFVALVALIPKKDGAAKISEFRPIVLIHSIAKLMAKVLSMQLSCVIDTVILPVLSAFLAKKYTHNSFFYVQNRVRSLHRKKTSLLLLKLDIAKGFNNVSWKYLLEPLQALHRKP